MRILIALGRSALLRRGESMTMSHQIANIRRAAQQIARLADGNQLVIAHGNGPQVGLLALQAAAAGAAGAAPLDVLDAESEGMIGYLLEQELANALPPHRQVATLLTRVEVDADDPAFIYPTKPIGPVYTEAQAERLVISTGWTVARDGAGFRRVVASPKPRRIAALQPIRWLLDHDTVVIAAGGGGIPVTVAADGRTRCGVEAVIDKDLCSALLAADVGADLLLIATDVDAVYADWHTPCECVLREVSMAGLRSMSFPAGSMGTKVEAACEFVSRTGRPAVIGSIDRIEAMASGTAGTRVTCE
ncbi:Carbamate kinase 2 [Paraburkholderia domus]|jgi:carbamate kinase|uniref:Carbamate kinase n=1 Tax=Paraburkholderia domus TaxID=2793075 RepID=A0A9N8N3J1_9BURK|nr:carbamate kinase [Paraburkholderia domus]MBK5052182.1 carbamate kinase [Burkholderia sp. R-70006]MBK5064337.1 carbamate kinase [Burkholderia sp. R-70199]MBK5089196.1 carbamate kinase [Burkholderia sp. R-69927]MBK5122669.1 carbamate kinase [Burkholderia sp. R-69980]MBK5168310.1 carbamate kinase [Burkholderia sp. R-70211]MBK5183516.1 carbamate kinase [Burkholderia sp. R-69749]MCI0149672.1 carbamate kinase [Paraburkholderia sediminicola]